MTTTTDFLLAIEDLTVSFDGFKAVDSLTMYIDKNELRVVIGPNGAGKTTLLDLICGKTKSSSGSISFKNKQMTKMAEHEIVRAGIGRKFQTPSIYENLTVYQNLEVSYPEGRGVFGSLFFKTTDEVIKRVNEVQDPELLMLDEPVAGMSAKERDETAELLNRICQNRSVIVIEHDMEFVKKIARKVTVLHQGKILAEGTMDNVQADEKVIEVYLGH